MIDFTKIFNKIKIKVEIKEKVGYREDDLINILETLDFTNNIIQLEEHTASFSWAVIDNVYYWKMYAGNHIYSKSYV